MSQQLPPPELLRQLLRYEPETGDLHWRERTSEMFCNGLQTAQHSCAIWNGRFAGKLAFTSKTNWGYLQGSIFNQKMLAHRVIWAIHNGAWPKSEIDHINGIRNDNRLTNLRDVTSSANKRNSKKPRDNTSGKVGVSWDRHREKWAAYISADNKIINLGRFSQKDDAVAARKNAEIIHGYHPNHGR